MPTTPQPTKTRSSACIGSHSRSFANHPDSPFQLQGLNPLFVRTLALSLVGFAPQLFKVLFSLCLLRIPCFSKLLVLLLLLYGSAKQHLAEPSRISPRKTNCSSAQLLSWSHLCYCGAYINAFVLVQSLMGQAYFLFIYVSFLFRLWHLVDAQCILVK